MGETGRLFGGRYRVDRELESGPGTQSLLVTDLRNGRPCVLRLLSVASATPAAARRFEALATILARLDHPGLPRFVDGFSEGEGDASVRAVVVSYHPGESLERLIVKGRPLTQAQALVLLRRIVPVLAYLHSFDPPLVHRTIRAAGIILGPDGRPCLTDLDYAIAERAVPSPEQAPPGPDELALAAPEVFMGGAVPATDIYALGLAVCRGMTAKEPAALAREGARMQLRAALGVSDAFAAVIARMLEVSLERRYPDAKALDADLARLAGVRVAPAQVAPVQQPQAHAADEPQRRRNARPLVLAGVALLLLAVLAVVALRLRTQPVPETPLLVPPAAREQAAAPALPAEAPPGAAPIAEAAPVPSVAPTAQPAVPSPVSPTTAAAGAADPNSIVAEGRLLFDGKPFVNPGAPAPLFWFRDEVTKKVVKPRVDVAAGAFSIRDLPPGRYAMSVRVDLEPRNPNIFPGDLTAWEEFTIESGRTASLEVLLRVVMHLVQPVDNGVFIQGWDVPCGAGNVSPGKLVFSWEALAAGTRYDVSVDRLQCGRGFATAGRIFTRSTTEAWVKIDLPPNNEGECYSFRLTANREGRTVGILSTHGKTGVGWDYRYNVADR